MGDATHKFFIEVFGETLAILRSESIPHLVIGSLANAAHLGEAWEPGSDIDLFVSKADAERCLEVFPSHGYATHVRDPSWIIKVAKPNVVIDLIFVAGTCVELDDDIMSHAVERPFETITLPVPSIEDMALLFSLLDSEVRQGHWYSAMRYIRRIEDWDYFLARSERWGPAKALSALLYARETEIEVPDRAIDRLAAAIWRD